MIFIAHRGLTNGPDKTKENSPSTILDAREKGFDCEIDLWVFYKNLWLGHDEPTYKIDEEFLSISGVWIHCKNSEALHYCMSKKNLKFFWHENDSYTLTSNGIIWSYPDKEVSNNTIKLMPEWKDPEFKKVFDNPCYGVCSDYVEKLKLIYSGISS
jgi:hypothetical protein